MPYFVVFFVLPGVAFSSGSDLLHFGSKRFSRAAIAIRTRMAVIRTRMQIVWEDSRPRPSRLRPNSSNVGVERGHVYYLSSLRYLWEVVVITFTLPSAEKFICIYNELFKNRLSWKWNKPLSLIGCRR